PRYRELLVQIAQLQIDGGVDGLHFAEVNNSFQGTNGLGDEGFDDYHLADFNAYLLWKYPAGTDFRARFGMTEDNILRHDVPAADLAGNFDYPRHPPPPPPRPWPATSTTAATGTGSGCSRRRSGPATRWRPIGAAPPSTAPASAAGRDRTSTRARPHATGSTSSSRCGA